MSSSTKRKRSSKSNESSQYPFKQIYDDGSYFEGTLVKGLFQGPGKMTWADGDVFEGVFDKGKRLRGEIRYANGDVYEGQFSNEFRHGSGVMRYSNGDVYTGRFFNGRKEGIGKFFEKLRFSRFSDFFEDLRILGLFGVLVACI